MNLIYKELVDLIDKEELFFTCKKSFYECMEKNQFNIDLTATIEFFSIAIIMKDFIDFDYYEVEAIVDIFNLFNNSIGYYRYIEDNHGNFVDEFLVGDFK
jgi:hypothetical protein